MAASRLCMLPACAPRPSPCSSLEECSASDADAPSEAASKNAAPPPDASEPLLSATTTALPRRAVASAPPEAADPPDPPPKPAQNGLVGDMGSQSAPLAAH